VSDNAKDLVKRMLDPDPKRRLTAQEVLGKWQPSFILGNHYYLLLDYGVPVSYFRKLFMRNADHPWLQNIKKAPNVSLGETVKARLKQFSMMNKLKKKALKVSMKGS